MGLAASQARLLTITARKADCEFQSMALSHQKLALSRDMENVSNEYQNALNTTKLVYDYYGSGDSEMPLTYGLLMSPSVYNDYYPKLVTDVKNRVILDSAYASAARAAGIPAEGLSGTSSSYVRDLFIEALANAGIITPTKAATIEGIPYSNVIGLGSTVSASIATTDVDYEQLITLLKANGTNAVSAGCLMGSDSNKVGPYDDAKDDSQTEYQQVWKDGQKIADGSVGTLNSGANITLSDLLSSDVVLYYRGIRSEQTPIMEAAQLQKDVTDNVLTWIRDEFAAVLGGLPANETALQYAYNAVYDVLYPNSDLVTMADKQYSLGGDTDLDEHTEWTGSNHGYDISETMERVGVKVADGNVSGYENVGSQANQYLGMVFSAKDKEGWHDDGKDHTAVAMDISNVAKAFLTSYVQYMEGIDNSPYTLKIGNLSNSNLYDSKRDDFAFTILSESDVDTGDEDLDAAFYDTMFNLICVNGWTENDRIDDEEYMTELLKSGMAFISSISDDGFYYQGTYSTDRAILEVTDDEAIARAEAKYNTEKAKIQNKEDTIDLKLKNLDTEISSLTTEYDTTKQVITKAVEKSFKRYEA